MSVSQSNLSAPAFGYDFVVATTQSAINSTMLNFMSALTEPQVVMCYISNGPGDLTAIDYTTLMTSAKGSDPFTVPANADPTTDQDLLNLAAVNFVAAFKAQIGLGAEVTTFPDVLVFDQGSAAVTFNLVCSAFAVVQYTPAAGSTPATWLSQLQPSNTPWVFASKVAIPLSTVNPGAYSQLPANIQAQIKNLGSTAFSVQQLLFDFSTAALESTPTITGVQPNSNLYTCLEKYFIGQYFSTLTKDGQPMLGCSIVPSTPAPSSLTLTNMNIQVDPFINVNGQPVLTPQQQMDLYTLNFLCAANNDPLPAPAPFTWNWLDSPQDESQFDGAIAVNSTTYVKWLSALLSPCLSTVCMIPDPQCWTSIAWWGKLSLNYNLVLNPDPASHQYTVLTNQQPDGSGFTPVLAFEYSEHRSQHGGQVPFLWGYIKCKYEVRSFVYLGNAQIKIMNELTAYIQLDYESLKTAGPFADYLCTLIYDLAVDAYGNLKVQFQQPATVQNVSEPADLTGWSNEPVLSGIISNVCTDVNTKMESLATAFDQSITSNLISPQNWVFPGGNTFVFKDVAFSNSLDLVAHITYANPT